LENQGKLALRRLRICWTGCSNIFSWTCQRGHTMRVIDGRHRLIATSAIDRELQAPMIYNPYFDKHGIDAVVVPRAARASHYARLSSCLQGPTSRVRWSHAAQGDLRSRCWMSDDHREGRWIMQVPSALAPTAKLSGICSKAKASCRGVQRKGRSVDGGARARVWQRRRRLRDRSVASPWWRGGDRHIRCRCAGP